jgi:hypothetical protein
VSDFQRPTREMVLADLTYFPETGTFARKRKRLGRPRSGVAGHVNKQGYRRIQVGSRLYAAHQLVWLVETGDWPSSMIDHRDGERDNNRFGNLRISNNSFNLQNQRRARADNRTAGLLGVSGERGKFRARIWVRGRSISLGHFADPGEAHSAYLSAKRSLHPGCTI